MNKNYENKGTDLSNTFVISNSRVKFEGQEFQHPTQSFRSHTPKIVQWIMRYSGGLIKDEKQASYILLAFVVLVIVISLLLIFGGGTKISRAALENPAYGLPESD